MLFTFFSSPALVLNVGCGVPSEPLQVESIRAQDSGWELRTVVFSKDFVERTTFNFLGHLKNNTGSLAHIFKNQRTEFF